MTTPLQEVFAVFKSKVDDKPLKTGKKSADRLTSAFLALGAAIGAAKIVSFGRDFIQAGAELDAAAKRVNVTTDALQELRFAAEQTAGARGLAQLEEALAQLAQKSVEVTQGSQSAIKDFADLGVEVRDANDELKDSSVLLSELATGFAETENITKATGTAMRLLGGAGKDLVPLLASGAVGIEELRAEFRALGGGLSTRTVEATVKSAAALARLDVVMDGIKDGIARELLPRFLKLVEALQKGAKWFQKATKGVDFLRIGMLALAPVVAALIVKGFQAMISPVGLLVVALLAMVVVVDDLITAYNGGTSAIQDFFQSFFGVDVIPVLDAIADSFFALQFIFGSVSDVARSMFSALDTQLQYMKDTVIQSLAEMARAIRPVAAALGALTGDGSTPSLDALDRLGATSARETNRRASANRRLQSETSDSVRRRALGLDQGLRAEQQRRTSERARQAVLRGASQFREANRTQQVNVQQQVTVNANGLTSEQAEAMVRRTLDSERRAVVSAIGADGES